MEDKIESILTIPPDHIKNIDPNMGPNLFNKKLRVMITPFGHIKHLEMLGSGDELEFIPLISRSKSALLMDNAFEYLEQCQNIHFKYALNLIGVKYKVSGMGIEIEHQYFIPDDLNVLILHVKVSNASDEKKKGYYYSFAEFGLGSPYYTGYSNRMGFIHVSNRLWPKYAGCMFCDCDGTEFIWAREMDVAHRLEGLRKHWTDGYHLGKSLEDSWGIFQVPFELSPGESSEFSIIFSGGTSETGGIDEIDDFLEEYGDDPGLLQLFSMLERKRAEYFSITTPDTLLDAGFAISHKICTQIYRGKSGPMALPGHMYPRFYARDSFWQMMGLLSTGHFEEVKGLIEHMIRFQDENGAFPTSINLKGEPIYFTRNEADPDSAAFPTMALLEYVRWSGDKDFGINNWAIIKNTIDYLRSRDTDGDGWLEQKPNQDWADTMKRHGNVNYTNAIFFKLLKDACDFADYAGITDPDLQDYRKQMDLMKSNYDGMFWDNKRRIYVDFVSKTGEKKKIATQDSCLAFIYGLTDDKERIQQHLEALKNNCWTQWGPAKQEPYEGQQFGPAGFYHNGGIWIWAASFEALARFLFGDPSDAVKMLDKIKEYDFGKNPYNAFYFDTNEWYDSRNGLNGEFNYKSCRNFTTGSGAHVWAIIRGLFGLNLGFDGAISFNPHFPKEWKGKIVELKNLRIHDKVIEKRFEI